MPGTELETDHDYERFRHGQLGDPYPLLRRLRETDPVHWSEPLGGWVLTRYEDILKCFLDTRLSSDKARSIMNQLPAALQTKAAALGQHLSRWVSHTDPPDHTRLRRLVNLAFTQRVINDMRPHIEQMVDALVDSVQAQGRMDLIKDFAYPLPVTVICELLGIPPGDREQFSLRVEDIVTLIDGAGPERPRAAEQAQASLFELTEYFGGIAEQRRREPRQDLISSLVALEEQGDNLSPDELLAMCLQILFGGHDTTTGLIGNAILSLLRNPTQMDGLKDDPTSIHTAVEEFLRFESPGPRNTRIALEDLEINGRAIRKGESVFLMVSAANRDPDQFPDPDRLDIHRQPNHHLAFGWGLHFCLGAPLARLASQLALGALLERLPNLGFANNDHRDNPPWRKSMGLRALRSLPVIF